MLPCPECGSEGIPCEPPCTVLSLLEGKTYIQTRYRCTNYKCKESTFKIDCGKYVPCRTNWFEFIPEKKRKKNG